jgi:hypothetical protein
MTRGKLNCAIACSRKIPFNSREDALRAADGFSTRERNGLRVRAYHCQACNFWHVGNQVKNRKQIATARALRR